MMRTWTKFRCFSMPSIQCYKGCRFMSTIDDDNSASVAKLAAQLPPEIQKQGHQIANFFENIGNFVHSANDMTASNLKKLAMRELPGVHGEFVDMAIDAFLTMGEKQMDEMHKNSKPKSSDHTWDPKVLSIASKYSSTVQDLTSKQFEESREAEATQNQMSESSKAELEELKSRMQDLLTTGISLGDSEFIAISSRLKLLTSMAAASHPQTIDKEKRETMRMEKMRQQFRRREFDLANELWNEQHSKKSVTPTR